MSHPSRRERKKLENELMGGKVPAEIQLPPNEDPLQTYDADGRELQGHPLRNLWRGRSVFLAGSGPSLQDIDLDGLRVRGVTTFGINNAAGHVPVNAMTFGDGQEKFHHGLFFDSNIMKLVPRKRLNRRIRAKVDGKFLWTKFRTKDCPNVFGYARCAQFVPEDFLTRDAASWGNNNKGVEATGGPKCLCTFLLALRLCIYLGARRIYLVGVDFNMENNRAYAFDRLSRGKADSNNAIYSTANHFLQQTKPFLDEAGIEIFNCNPQSRLQGFDVVKFDYAMGDVRAGVPSEPFDLDGWYTKSEGFECPGVLKQRP